MRNEVAAMPSATYGNQNGTSRRYRFTCALFSSFYSNILTQKFQNRGGISGRLRCGNRPMRPPGNRGSGGAGGGSRCRGRGRGRGGEGGEKVSTEDLDADLKSTMHEICKLIKDNLVNYEKLLFVLLSFSAYKIMSRWIVFLTDQIGMVFMLSM
ncbi:ribonuclease H-like domain, reverse transcriptase, RNA-dependent DNA polymerase [Tanacetum coccineum]